MNSDELIALQKQLDKIQQEYQLNEGQNHVIHNAWGIIHSIRERLIKEKKEEQ